MKALPLLLALAAPALHAATVVNVSFSADGSSRYYEYFSNVYAQLDQGFGGDPALDGFFLIEAEGGRPAGSPVGGGADVFPYEGNWSNVGTLTLNGTATGVGTETFSFSAAAFDFSKYMADDDSVFNAGYTTSFSSLPTGSVTIVDGVVTDLSFVGPVVFNYNSPLGSIPFAGTLNFDETGFTLAVDETANTPFGPFRYRWDATGTSAFTVVPEPSAAMLGLLAGVLAFRRRR